MGEKLDHEWLELIVKAKQLGISIEEIREFLLQGNEGETSKQMKK